MSDRPFAFHISQPDRIPDQFDTHICRRLSAMAGQFSNRQAYDAMLNEEDIVIYEVYEIMRPKVPGELLHGISMVHPGKVGDEYFMTKGHFHSELETAEIYYCLRGEGAMVMETPEGEWSVDPLYPGRVLYVPPRWAHRSVNTSSEEDLVTFFVYPGHAGHDYGSIEKQGFRKLIVEDEHQIRIVDNPRWLPPKER
jgi:glucose-6-phosphate isomerase